MKTKVILGLAIFVAVGAIAAEQVYVSADREQRLSSGKTEILPERFLRGYDPITIYFNDNIGPGHGPADDVSRLARIKPAWPGAWTWLDKKTLQFRPAEPWPALQRFAVESERANRVLSTMMAAPTSMQPADGSNELRPFRTFTLTFPQALPLDALKQMIKLEIRQLPGLADSPRVVVDKFTIAELPRRDHKEHAGYAVTLDEEVGEGRLLVVTLALALGDEGRALWTGRAATRTEFSLEEVSCGGDRLTVIGAPHAKKESALDCGSQGEAPQLVFSAVPRNLTLTGLKKLVRLEPSVPDLKASTFGKRVQLEGRFVPDTLYKMKISASPITDEEGRALSDPGDTELYFYVGWKRPFLRFREGQSVLEARGPRMIPLVGYGEPRADVRIYRVDPKHTGLWPFPSAPVVVNEDTAPPFPGEEPNVPALGNGMDAQSLTKHLRLLGSPLVSRVFELPLKDKGGTTSFGLDIGPALDAAVGARRPGTYLIGLRRLQGPAERSYVRVTVTNMTLTAVEERGMAALFVRTLDGAQPVDGAKITVEAHWKRRSGIASLVLATDSQGKAVLPAQPEWSRIIRMTVEKGDDVLILDPNEPPPRFFMSHWSSGGSWLSHIVHEVPQPQNDRSLGFVFTERPIYRPGEKVFLKAFARDKRGGVLVFPSRVKGSYTFKVAGPGGQEWTLPANQTTSYGFDAVFQDADPPTGRYTATLQLGNAPIASRGFQIEAYRIPTFEVQLSGPARARLDAPFRVKALARYYAGGNVANEKIRWTVTRRPLHHVPKGREGFLFASSAQFARPEARAADERTEKAAELSDDGQDEIEVNPALDLDGSPRTYRFEATVTGADNQEVSAVTEVDALPPFVLGMKLPRYSKQPMKLEPEIIAVGVDDRLLAGQKVQVRLFKRTWHSHLRESQFATGQASYVTEQEDKKITEVDIETKGDVVRAPLSVAEAGVYVVEISARDKLGRLQTLSADLYVGGKEPVAWQKGQAGVFELVPDKKSYAPGETANIVVKSPFTRAQALIIVEEPLGNRYSFVSVDNGAAVISVPVSREHVPNLPVHVVLMRGRLGESPNDDAPYRPQTMGSSIEIEVAPKKNQAQVAVKHPESARPGQTVNMEVTLKDDKGAPLSGEVTLWLVDEAVLSLASEGTLDPLTAFIVRNTSTSSVLDTRNRTVGRVIDEEAPGGDGAEGDESQGVTHRRVRKNFQTVPYYQATLNVPASGKLTVPVTLSDDLTNFMVRAVAASGAERFGKHESRLRVRLPVLVQPQLPRFVRQGDRFDGGAIARVVEGPDGPGIVRADFTGPIDERKRSRDVPLSGKKAQSVTFPIQVTSAPTTQDLKVKMDVTRKSDNVGDAFEVTIPVLPDRHFEETSVIEMWTPGAHKLAPLPEPARPGTVQQEVTISSVPGLLEVLAALQYTDGYPHGCLEQKMSRLAPQLAVNELASVTGFEYGKALSAHVKKFLEEAVLHQDDAGLYAYWPGSPGQVQLTADVLAFAVMAERLGVPLDATSKNRATEALRKALRSDYRGYVSGYQYNEQTAALRTLFFAGSYDEHYLVDLFRTRKSMDATSRAELVLAMNRRRATFEGDLKVAREELWDSVVFNLDKGKRVFTGLSDPRKDWGGTVLGSPTSSIAVVLEALIAVDPKNADLALVFDGLVRRSRGKYGFGSTYDNRRAVQTIIAYLLQASIGSKKTTATLSSQANKTLAEIAVSDKPKLARASVFDDAPLTVTTKGDTIAARVRTTFLPATPGDRVGAKSDGFIVQRSMTVLPKDGSASYRKDDNKGGERELNVGDVVEIHATMTTDVARTNVALVVPFAAGFEPLNPELKNAPAEAQPSGRDSIAPTYVQRLDHEARYYFTTLAKGTSTFHYRLKVTTPGSYVHPAPYAELMYDESVRGRGDGMRILVKGSSE